MISGKGFEPYNEALKRGDISPGHAIGVKVPGFFQEGGGTLFYTVLVDGRLECWQFGPVQASEVLHKYPNWEHYPRG